jgi:hypothetical protein
VKRAAYVQSPNMSGVRGAAHRGPAPGAVSRVRLQGRAGTLRGDSGGVAREQPGDPIGQTQLPEDWQTAALKCRLGECLLGQKRFAEAEPLLHAGYEGLKRRERELPARGSFLADAAALLARLYQAADCPDQAADWTKKAQASPQPSPENPRARGQPC